MPLRACLLPRSGQYAHAMAFKRVGRLGGSYGGLPPHFGAGFVVSLGSGWRNSVHTADLQMILHPDTLSWCWDSRRIFALACMFMSGMNSFPCQLPSLRTSRWVSRCVPTRLGVAFLESCLALSLAHAIVPHGLCPQLAIFMMLLPPGLRQVPAIYDG